MKFLKKKKIVLEDLIVDAHKRAKKQIKVKMNDEISKATGGIGFPNFKWPL